jgi:hypothetical protein
MSTSKWDFARTGGRTTQQGTVPISPPDGKGWYLIDTLFAGDGKLQTFVAVWARRKN